MEKQRLVWIDIMKGIGIISVIYAHSTGHIGVFIYAIPLFFMLSGYMHKPSEDIRSFFLKTFRRMLIPYLTFFLVISLFHIIESGVSTETLLSHGKLLIWGGNRMSGDFGVFWFINVLFMALNSFNYMQIKHCSHYVYVALFVGSFVLYFWNVNLPWNVQSLPLALSYMYIGTIMRHCVQPCVVQSFVSVKICIMGGVIIILLVFAPNILLDIKKNLYGIPLFSFVLSVMAVLGIGAISVKLSFVKLPSLVLAYCGKASLFLMFAHQFIHFRLMFLTNVYLVFFLTAIFSIFSYYVVYKFRMGRKYLCGEK